MGLENAINYRLVSYILGFSVSEKWGYKNNSEGYKELKRIFEDKYKPLTVEEFKDEIILAWIGESYNKKIVKRSMSQVLNQESSNEEYRYLFTKICKKVKSQNEENLLTGIPNEIINNNEDIKNIVTVIDNEFDKIIELARNKEFNFEFEYDEICNIIFSIKNLEIIKYNLNLDKFDDDSFLELILKNANKKINKVDLPSQNYTEQMILEIRNNFTARINTILPNKKFRERTKETIFDKLDYSKTSKMTLEDFLLGYEELMELYFEINNINDPIDKLIKFYNIESRYNLIFYINIVIDLFEVSTLSKIEIANKISKLALMDWYIYRSSKMKGEINKFLCTISEKDKNYQMLIKNISDLVILKNKIIDSLLEVKSLKLEDLNENDFNIISLKAKQEILNQLNKVDLIKYLGFNNDEKMKRTILRNLKYLMENNKKILLQRSRLKNIKYK